MYASGNYEAFAHPRRPHSVAFVIGIWLARDQDARTFETARRPA